MPSQQQIEKWTKEGQYPFPKGVTVLEPRKPNPEGVKRLAQLLSSRVTPDQREIIKNTFGL